MSVSPTSSTTSSDPYNSAPGDLIQGLINANDPNTNGSSSSSSTSGTSSTSSVSPYQAEFLTLQQQDTAELLYASFLSPSDALANADSVFGQAATLLGTPGQLPAATTTTSSSSSTSTSSSSSDTSSSSSSASSSSASGSTDGSDDADGTDPLANLPSVSTLLAQSDATAQATLQAYAGAPTGSSIIDYQA